MKLALIIPTLGRPGQVKRLLAHLARQSRLPDEVIVSAPDASHVDLPEISPFPISLALGSRGLAAQRNAAMAPALGRFDIITFFDDDFVPADDYLELVERSFAADDGWAVVMGRVVRDGAGNAGLTWDDAAAALGASRDGEPVRAQVVDHVGAYGCNMSIRARLVRELRFDERLVLYGWQEDIDFTSQLRSRGRVVCVSAITGVHLGLKAGRVSGKRFGYSQVANPVYLVLKGSVPASFALPLMGRNVVANLARSLWPETYVDRRGRLHGNLLALVHVLSGRIEPEYILKI